MRAGVKWNGGKGSKKEELYVVKNEKHIQNERKEYIRWIKTRVKKTKGKLELQAKVYVSKEMAWLKVKI